MRTYVYESDLNNNNNIDIQNGSFIMIQRLSTKISSTFDYRIFFQTLYRIILKSYSKYFQNFTIISYTINNYWRLIFNTD